MPQGRRRADERRRREIHDPPKSRHDGPPRHAPWTQTEGPERLQRFLARAGIGSRRSCEELILQGRVSIDGQTVRELGTKVDPSQQTVELDGQKVQPERLVYFAVHKPRGYVSTNHDPAGRPRVIDLVAGVPERVYAVGRLDEDSTGLLILTNDGDLANRLAHPRFGVEKVYRALVAGSPTREVLDKLVEGVWLSDGKARAKRVRPAGKRGEATMLEMVLAEGKNREVRRMLAKLGHKVMSLQRVAVGPISLKGLPVGQSRHLNGREVDLLRRLAAGEQIPTAQFADQRERYPSRAADDLPRRGAGRHQQAPRSTRERGPVAGAPRPTGPRPAGDRPTGPRPPSARPGGPPPRTPARGVPKQRREREIEVGPEIERTLVPPITPQRPGTGPGPRPRRGGPKPKPAAEGPQPQRRIIGLGVDGPSPSPAPQRRRRPPSAGRPAPGRPGKPRTRPLPKPRRSRRSEGETGGEEA